jgi:hypothetical protein
MNWLAILDVLYPDRDKHFLTDTFNDFMPVVRSMLYDYVSILNFNDVVSENSIELRRSSIVVLQQPTQSLPGLNDSLALRRHSAD